MRAFVLFSVIGLAVHIVFLISIFDIYFKSPIIHGLQAYEVPLSAPAKRLVLFIADGLRADKLFELQENGTSRAPYLRSVITEKGTWGISHTRVPTESRPGHVALIAGFYEDVSAVTKGWKANPVDFDSVFNRSKQVWAWGAYDILHLFTKGDHGKRVAAHGYDTDNIDFADHDASRLDTWVFDNFEQFLLRAAINDSLSKELKQEKVVFFLHLLGLDTNGHGHNPDSKEYYENIALVDRGIQRVVKLVETFFDDGLTAYICTSDHGMTDWGNHGAGGQTETETPIVAWGAGIAHPKLSGKDIYFDGYAEAWKLTMFRRIDINQADVAPLMAVLIGVAIPVNSVGLLPVEYLGTDWHFKAVALLTNARQILAQYKQQKHIVQQHSLSMFFRHYKELMPKRQVELTEMIETLLKQSRYKEAIQVIQKFVELSLKGLVYYQRYDRVTLSIAVALGFLSWISLGCLLLLRFYTGVMSVKSLESQSHRTLSKQQGKIKLLLCAVIVSILSSSLLYVQNAPFMYYLYFFIPILLGTATLYESGVYYEAKKYMRRTEVKLWFLALGLLAASGLELLVIAFFYRGVMSIGLFFIGLWPFTTTASKKMGIMWLTGCMVLSIFPLLPVVGKQQNYALVTLTGWLSIVVLGYCARRPELGLVRNSRQLAKEPQRVVVITVVQIMLIWVAITIVRSTADSIEQKTGLPLVNQVLSWILLVTSPALCFFSSTSLFNRLQNIMLSLLVPFLLTCISYEGLFLLALCFVMFLWICIEHELSGSGQRLQDMTFGPQTTPSSALPYHIKLDDVRKAFFFIFFMFVSFYGTGNIASLNSFSVSSFYCFMTVFRPFLMAAVLLIKVLIPLLIVSCAFRALLQTISVSNTALFLLVMIMSDFMALHFFFLIKDSGSWLDIGMSISHYLLAMGMSIFTAMFHGLAWLLTSFTFNLDYRDLKRHLL